MLRILPVVLLVLACACATASSETIKPDDVPAGASGEALDRVALCKSSYAEVKALLGEPYRDGLVHDLRVRTWKLKSSHGAAEPAVLAFRDGVVVDVCYDVPGILRCHLEDQCENASGEDEPQRGGASL